MKRYILLGFDLLVTFFILYWVGFLLNVFYLSEGSNGWLISNLITAAISATLSVISTTIIGLLYYIFTKSSGVFNKYLLYFIFVIAIFNTIISIYVPITVSNFETFSVKVGPVYFIYYLIVGVAITIVTSLRSADHFTDQKGEPGIVFVGFPVEDEFLLKEYDSQSTILSNPEQLVELLKTATPKSLLLYNFEVESVENVLKAVDSKKTTIILLYGSEKHKISTDTIKRWNIDYGILQSEYDEFKRVVL